jgi:hypothetical protein
MAAPTNTLVTYSLRGQKEDVDDSIYNFDPTATPFVSSLGSFKVDARTHQWQEDTLRAPNKDNAAIEGDDFTGSARTPTFLLRNVIQTVREDVVTSGLSNAIAKYGRKSEQDYQMAKTMILVRQDVEAAFLSNNIGVVGNATTASKIAGLELYANVNVLHGATGSTAAIANDTLPVVAPTDGTLRALDETIWRTALRTMWESGAKPSVAYLSINQKSAIDQFAGTATRRTDIKPSSYNQIVGSVGMYYWEGQIISFVPVYNNRIRNRTLFITDGECIERGYVRPLKKYSIAPTGDAEKEMVLTDVCLKVKNRKGVMKVADLS